jgi:hypothetical protein
MVKQKLYEVGAVSYLLAATLGAGKQWVDALNDYRQGKADIHGLRLYPIAHTGGTPERAGQPLYSAEDLKAFVEAVRVVVGCKMPFPVNALEYEYDSTPGLEAAAWRYRTATAPAAKGSRRRAIRHTAAA